MSSTVRFLRALLAMAVLTAIAAHSAVAWQDPIPTPAAQGYRGSGDRAAYRGAFVDLAIEIDRFWQDQFQAGDVPYQAPDIFAVERFTLTACGPIEPVPNAFYCPGDRTIYLVPAFLEDQERQFGDFAPIAVLSHEWGHHIQALLGITGGGPPTKAIELQADCLMGAFTRHADDRSLLDYGDFMEALSSAIDAGDDTFLPEDAPGAHGQAEDRVKALTRGFGGGPAIGCGLPFGSSPAIGNVVPRVQQPPSGAVPSEPLPAAPEVSQFLPQALPLPHATCFRVDDEGTLTFDQLRARLGGSDDAANRLRDWGWRASAFRVFACDGPPDGEAGYIDIGLHLFADGAAAQDAVDYFAAIRAEGTRLASAAPPAIGDHAAVLSGPTGNGNEFTLYVSRGPLLARITGVAPQGIPFGNVLAVAREIIATASDELMAAPPALPDLIPATLPVSNAACFAIRDDRTLTLDELSRRFRDRVEALAKLRDWGWQESVYRELACDSASPGDTGWIDLSIHRFADARAAQDALAYFVDERAAGTALVPGDALSLGDRTATLTGPTGNGAEFTLYTSTGPLLIRVTGVARAGTPDADVIAVAEEIVTASEG